MSSIMGEEFDVGSAGLGGSMVSGREEASAGYPVEKFNNFLHGPVLSHVEAIDALRDKHAFLRSTYEGGFWILANAELVRDALQRPELFSSSVVTPLDPDPPYKWIPEIDRK